LARIHSSTACRRAGRPAIASSSPAIGHTRHVDERHRLLQQPPRGRPVEGDLALAPGETPGEGQGEQRVAVSRVARGDHEVTGAQLQRRGLQDVAARVAHGDAARAEHTLGRARIGLGHRSSGVGG
jgi:hypothetical protein